MLVRRVEIIPLEVVLRNIATGSLCRQTPIAEGTAIAPALMDLYYKDDALGDPLLTEARVQLLGVADPARLSAIEQLARRVNAVLQPFFEAINLKLVDFKLELGLASDGTLLLADEISPDTCRLWDRSNSNGGPMDKDRFRKDLGGVMEATGRSSNGSKALPEPPQLPVRSAHLCGFGPACASMTRRSSRRSSVAVRRAVLGLMLGIPPSGRRFWPRKLLPRC